MTKEEIARKFEEDELFGSEPDESPEQLAYEAEHKVEVIQEEKPF